MDYFNHTCTAINRHFKTSLSLHGLGLGSLFCYYQILGVQDWRSEISSYFVALLALSLLFTLANCLLQPTASESGNETGRKIALVLFWGGLLRIVFIIAAPPDHTSLSSDVYRYLWEGEVIAAGENPYRLPPDSPQLAALQTKHAALHSQVAHQSLGSIYPPGAQYLFAVLPNKLSLFRVVLIVFDCFTLGMLWRFLVNRPDGAQRLLWYAWLPLPLLEIAYSAHLEGLFLPLIVLALLRLQTGATKIPSACLLALAMSIKYVAVVPLGYLVLGSVKESPLPRRILLLALPLLIFLLPFLPFLDQDLSVFSSLRTYGEHWRFNGGLFQGIEALLEGLLEQATLVSKLIGAALLLILGVLLIQHQVSVCNASILTFAAILLLSPTVYPWYLLWFAVLLPLSSLPRWINYSLLSFCWSSLLSYAVLAHPERWELSWEILAVEYLLPIVVGAVLYIQERKMKEE